MPCLKIIVLVESEISYRKCCVKLFISHWQSQIKSAGMPWSCIISAKRQKDHKVGFDSSESKSMAVYSSNRFVTVFFIL